MRARKTVAICLMAVLLMGAGPRPYNCGWAGWGLGLAIGGLIVSTASGNPFAVFMSSFTLANALSNYAACKEANGQG